MARLHAGVVSMSFLVLMVGVTGAADNSSQAGGGRETAQAATAKTELDVKRVALFSSGVGFFVREAQVTGDSTAELSFRTEQINDIIKSMILQDFGGGKIGVISYASRDPVEKTLRSFGVDLTGKPTLSTLLDQLRGEPVKIAGPREMTGRIVGVEKSEILSPDGKVVQTIERLTLYTDAGLQRVALTEIQGIELQSEKVAAELKKALETLATMHDADKKSVTINFEGAGQRQVRVAYLLEAPIWKTSYRLGLGDTEPQAEQGRPAAAQAQTDVKKAGPFLQGWATVENTTENDWNNVRLSLISGRPISFRMDLYTPLYVPRPLVQMDLYASLRPPEYEGGFAEDKAARGMPMEASPPATAPAMGGRMAARAKGVERLGGGAGSGMFQQGQGPDASAEGYVEGFAAFPLADAGIASVATAQEAGELFQYAIDTPVSIPRQHSAMLPIVNQAVEADKLSIYNPGTHPKHPLNGAELKNTTGLHLMQGPVTIFDDNVYAGDAKLPDMKPNEKRLIGYALDLAREVMINQKPAPEELVSVRIVKGTLYARRKFSDAREYVINNKADKPRSVLLEQPYSADWKLVEPEKPYEITQNLLRIKVDVPADETKKQMVRLERIADQTVALTNLGRDDIQIYIRSSVISPKVKEALEKVIALRDELDQAVRHRERIEKQYQETIAEQARIRDNLKTLDHNTDTYQRQLKKFDEFETQIESLKQQLEAARKQEDAQRRELEQFLLSLDIE
ncbi:MAG: hypothetical protein AB1716_14835 [Planctomycetota bacterium]